MRAYEMHASQCTGPPSHRPPLFLTQGLSFSDRSTGTVLSYGVKVSAGHTTMPYSRVWVGETNDPAAVGAEGKGCLWIPAGPENRFLDVHLVCLCVDLDMLHDMP